MRTGRLVSMLLMLQARGRITARALADEFEVSVRTVYRDVDQLSAAGVPVYADRGPGGGFALLDGYRTDLTGMTRAEAETLPIAGLPGAADALGLAEPLRSAQLKLVAALPKGAAGASRIGSRLHIDPVDWYRRPEPAPLLPLLATAVWEQKRIAMHYRSWSDTQLRRCAPLGLVLKAGNWYLVAKARTRIGIYKASSIEDLEMLDETFERPDGFDLQAHWSQMVVRFEQNLLKDTATLLVKREAISDLHALGAAAADRAVCGLPDDEGWCRVTLPVEEERQAARQLLRLGPRVRVLEPPALRDALCRLAREVAEMNAPA
ncbi:helix-turn-helix transcriptional regulator [Trinickia dinghuensis]|uniref:WYL domain-containing protein n=1 Tax=Trinickia dinghuensis TaxID=2291023 RepID=A0A3D8JZA6_9BURK|nr:WYL domain-containing protein [Trinickia dinghuensis]RDU97954.1 WYL domain-containing protein [Trinickia dinghuensis]